MGSAALQSFMGIGALGDSKQLGTMDLFNQKGGPLSSSFANGGPVTCWTALPPRPEGNAKNKSPDNLPYSHLQVARLLNICFIGELLRTNPVCLCNFIYLRS